MLKKQKVVPHSEWAYPILHVHLFMQRHIVYCMYQKEKLPGFTKSKIVTRWLVLLTLYKLNMKIINMYISSVQSCPTLYDLTDCSIPGFPVHSPLLELAQTHVHQVSDPIHPSHLLSSPCSPAFNLSQHQGLFQWVSSLHQVVKVLELQLQHQSFQWIFRTNFF